MTRIRAASDMDLLRELFREYQAGVDAPVCFASFDSELAGLPEPYARILVAEVDGKAVGCVALKPLDGGILEVKRLYVRSVFRRLGVGEALMRAAIAAASELGGSRLRLDTLPFMARAIDLYTRLGFVPISRYNDTPHPGTLFFELTLHPAPR